jgi:splicing factor 3B subunit 3
MLDASIDKNRPTLFVNIGLNNGVLLRTMLDPVQGSLTDTRTRYAILLLHALIMGPVNEFMF